MEQHFRHMSIPGRLAFATLVPLAIASGALVLAWTGTGEDTDSTLLSGALLFTAFGCALVLLNANVRSMAQPLEDAHRFTQALARGDYDQRLPVDRLDEIGRLLVALHGLGDYLAVMLPEEEEPASARLQHRVVPTLDTLDAIARRLHPVEHTEATPPSTNGKLRLVARQV